MDTARVAAETGGEGRRRIMVGARGRTAAAGAFAAVALIAGVLSGCAAEDPTPSGATGTPTPTDIAPPPSATGSVQPLDDGTYRAAVYAPTEGTIEGEPDLEAGTLVDLGDGCLGLEAEDGTRSLVAFPVGTTLVDGRVSAAGMDAFGLGQPLRYEGATGSSADGAFSLALPDGCPGDVTDVWYFVVPSSAGLGSPADD
jgi:hypothetical protein